MRQHRRNTRVVALAAFTLVVLTGCGRSTFVPYAPTADLVPALSDTSTIHLGSEVVPDVSDSCDVDEFRWVDPGPDASEWRMVIQRPPSRDRTVSFLTRRFSDQQQFDDTVAQIEDGFGTTCVSTDNTSIPEVEPISIEGLPDGAVSAQWSDRGDTTSRPLATVIADRDRRLMMMVVWVESPDDVPVDDFVRVVNTAWSDFDAENS